MEWNGTGPRCRAGRRQVELLRQAGLPRVGAAPSRYSGPQRAERVLLLSSHRSPPADQSGPGTAKRHCGVFQSRCTSCRLWWTRPRDWNDTMHKHSAGPSRTRQSPLTLLPSGPGEFTGQTPRGGPSRVVRGLIDVAPAARRPAETAGDRGRLPLPTEDSPSGLHGAAWNAGWVNALAGSNPASRQQT